MDEILLGISGTPYTYQRILDDHISSTLQAVPGNFIFARVTPRGVVVVYVGESANLAAEATHMTIKGSAVATHKCNATFWHRGATDRKERVREELDLIRAYLPPVNEMPPEWIEAAAQRYGEHLRPKTQ
jgi:hypothetical protein